MEISLIAAVSENNVIGSGMDIPWVATGEQLLFKAMTYNQWLIVGRKTFESMGKLPNRKYAVITRTATKSTDENIQYFTSTESAIAFLKSVTSHAFVAGGGEIYRALISQADTIHISTIHTNVDGDVLFPNIPPDYQCVFKQSFNSNINYTYAILKKM